ncbi:MAG: hypothetical protein WDM91_19200 [Rhizomicrobium sp.]
MSTQPQPRPSWLQRYILPGLAFKAVVIGGGYATGRELAQFFLPSGPTGGLLAILVATLVWSVVCVLTFAYSHAYRLLDYRAFFGKLLGRGWIVFEVTYLLFVLLIISVFAAASGAIGQALFGWPTLAGALLLLVAIAGVVAIGPKAVEPLFKYVSILLYLTYALFLGLSLSKFGGQILSHLATAPVGSGWLQGGITYAGYNSVAAVVILPVLRHLTSRRDAIVAGLIAGPLAMLPGLFFFLSMIAWYPQVGAVTLPSDFLLMKIDIPVVRLLFQGMIFFALLESGTGAVHAIMERVRHALHARTGIDANLPARGAITLAVLTISVFAAQGIGLVDLIAKGYTVMSWILIAIFILPMIFVSLTKGAFLRA